MPIGYSVWGPTIAKVSMRKPWVAKLLSTPVRAILYHELYLSGSPVKFNLAAWGWHKAFEAFSQCVGVVARCFGAEFGTRDPEILALLKHNNLYFKL